VNVSADLGSSGAVAALRAYDFATSDVTLAFDEVKPVHRAFPAMVNDQRYDLAPTQAGPACTRRPRRCRLFGPACGGQLELAIERSYKRNQKESSVYIGIGTVVLIIIIVVIVLALRR
jgi:hypothetical protein